MRPRSEFLEFPFEISMRRKKSAGKKFFADVQLFLFFSIALSLSRSFVLVGRRCAFFPSFYLSLTHNNITYGSQKLQKFPIILQLTHIDFIIMGKILSFFFARKEDKNLWHLFPIFNLQFMHFSSFDTSICLPPFMWEEEFSCFHIP